MKKKIIIPAWLALLALSYLYWKPDPSFYFWDEWTFLQELRDFGLFRWVFLPHLEHFIPLSKALYGGLIYIFNEKQYPLWIMLYSIHSINILLTEHLLFQLTKNKWISIPSALFFGFHYLHYENLLWTLQSQILLCQSMILLSLLGVTSRSAKWQLTSLISAALSGYFFSFGLIAPLICIIYGSAMASHQERKWELIRWQFLIFILNCLIYISIVKNGVFVHSMGIEFEDLKAIFSYIAHGILVNPSHIFMYDTLGNTMTVNMMTILMGLLGFALVKKKDRKILISTLIYFVICFVPLALSRFRFGAIQSESARYVYLYFLPLLLAFSIILKSLILQKKSLQILPLLLLSIFFLFSWKSQKTFLKAYELKYELAIKELREYDVDKTKEIHLGDIFPRDQLDPDFANTVLKKQDYNFKE